MKIFSFFLVFVWAGISHASDLPMVKISVLKSGYILLNGKNSELSEVENEFSRLSKVNGTVWYYREASNEEPSARVIEAIKSVLDLVVKYRLPITMSTKPDFSDYIGPDGNPHSRSP